jgi:16S rRNA (uracil1498-N3)-methyltransferase
MARRRFFVPEIHSGRAELNGDDAAHLVRVLRAAPGQLYEVCDNSMVYLAEIESARKSSVIFRCIEKLPLPAREAELVLVTALFKFDRFEWLIEKATEIGVASIIPFAATRTEKGLELAAGKRAARWQRIAIEACEQARRARLPVIHPVFQWGEALATEATIRLLLDEDPPAPPLTALLPASRQRSDSIAVMLGPEGGWTPNERAAANSKGWASASLGGTVLRAETAGLAALAVVRAIWHPL